MMLIIVAMAVMVLPPKIAYGAVDCVVSVSPSVAPPGSLTNFAFTVDNSGDEDIVWIEVTRPSSNFSIDNSDIAGWNGSTPGPDQTTQNGGTLYTGDTAFMNVSATTENVQAGPASWQVQASSDPNGANPQTCSGALETAISGSAPDATPPNIYNLSVATLKTTRVTISWTTDEPSTSSINYGEDDQYGSSVPESLSLTTSHQMTIEGLEANKAYHFQVGSRDSSGNEAVSDDNTFLTPAVDTPDINQISTDVAPKAKIPLKAVPTEKVPPTVSIATPLDRPYKVAPTISGQVNDNEAVAGIEYSTDGGQNWLPVDTEQGLGSKLAKFSFTPANLEDGDYVIRVRSIDTSSNVGVSDPKTLVIDRLPPQVGGNLVTVGAQSLVPRADGVITSLAGIDEQITTSAVGGANAVTITASNTKTKIVKTFSLTQSRTSGLWSGVMSFKEPGVYTLSAQSVDGAGNKTTRTLNTMYVHDSPRLLSKGDKKPIKNAKVTLYYLEPSTNTWTVWDGRAYGQENAQLSNEHGQYKLFVPPGKYYLKAEANNYRVLLSNIFETKKSTPILSTLYMKEAFSFKAGPINIHIPPFSNDTISFNVETEPIPLDQKNTAEINKNIPDFTLSDNNNKSVHSATFSGKPTVVSFISSWSPASKDQLPSLSQLQRNKNINTIPIAVQERAGLLTAQAQISGNPLTFLQDPDGVTVQKFNINSLPTHYFLDRHGVVKKVMIGTLTTDEIVRILTEL